MATISSKYSVGDKVWYASSGYIAEQKPCPACKGVKTCVVVQMNGDSYEVDCPVCSHGYYSMGVLEWRTWKPRVQELTIAKVQFTSYDDEDSVKYMTEETGCPSGQVISEGALFTDEERAKEEAQSISDRKNKQRETLEETELRKRKNRFYKKDYYYKHSKRLEKRLKELESEVLRLGGSLTSN